MTLADLIRRLDEAGAPAAAIAIAVEAVEDERAAAPDVPVRATPALQG